MAPFKGNQSIEGGDEVAKRRPRLVEYRFHGIEEISVTWQRFAKYAVAVRNLDTASATPIMSASAGGI